MRTSVYFSLKALYNINTNTCSNYFSNKFLIYGIYICYTNELQRRSIKMVKGLVMNTEELKRLVIFFRSQGVSPTVKELCSINMFLNHYNHRKAS